MNDRKKIKIGFDLDGVLIDKPPLIPKMVLESLVLLKVKNKLVYRYPELKFERWIRQLSHHYLFRSPLQENVEIIYKLAKNKKNKIFVVSGRYRFLQERTQQWLSVNKLSKVFEKIYINKKNEQPHLFKERLIKELKIEIFIDDDKFLVKYLRSKLPRVKVILFNSKTNSLIEDINIQDRLK
jgi:uncharacterized HAD superfamily protein